MPVLRTTNKTPLTAADGAGWVRLGAVPVADAVARAKGNGKDDVVAQVGRDVYVASSTRITGTAAPDMAIALNAPGGERLVGAIVHADHEGPKPPLPAWKQNVAYAGGVTLVLGFGLGLAATFGLLGAALAPHALIVGGLGFLAVVIATDMQL